MLLRTIVLAQMSEIRELHDADLSTERGDSTTGTGDHLAGAGDSITGIGHSTIGTGYCTTGTAGTRWRYCIFFVIEENGTKTSHKAMIDQGVIAALVARDANRNGDDSHTSATGGRRTERVVMRNALTKTFIVQNLYISKALREI
ncbi:hypothetical protein Tco_1515559 [Tanacetum coccineum]